LARISIGFAAGGACSFMFDVQEERENGGGIG
jgi:hypothetical protein